MKFQYKTKFTTFARCLVNQERQDFLAKASLEDLKTIIPSQAIGSDDLVPFAANLFVANITNLNDCIVLGEDALNLYKSFLFKPINRQHNQQAPIGVIVNTALSEFDINYLTGAGSKVLTEEEVRKNINSPFNCAVAGVLFRIVDPEAVNEIEDSGNINSDNYSYYSLSFEVVFSDFIIGRGSAVSNKMEFITDAKQINDLKPRLRQFKGKGTDENGNKLYCVMKGEMMGVGAAITSKPAALLKGLVTPDDADTSTEIEITDNEDSQKVNSSVNTTVVASSTSQNKNSGVNNNEDKGNIRMKKLKNFAELKGLTQDELSNVCIASIMEVTQASIQDEVTKGIEEASKKYSEQIKEKESKNKEALEKAEAAEKKAKELENKLTAEAKAKDELAKKIEKVEAEIAQKARDEKFQTRMTSISEKFELNDKQTEAVASEIKDLDDAGFDKWLTKFELFAAKKTVPAKPVTDCKDGKCGECASCKKKPNSAKASVELTDVEIEAALNAAKAEKEKIANNRQTDDKKTSLKKSFTLGEGIELVKK